ncbi:hypothetical protein O6P43_005902 [Quillaja saponaria]|uniref:Uncharacterized protein n=1 Tax=Quillaja saponaria TaxID=32244 RepID=A0AAD7Q725_QUISA|nr:hypothetical protein O6P43_005902 [Quillaja saponaria]
MPLHCLAIEMHRGQFQFKVFWSMIHLNKLQGMPSWRCYGRYMPMNFTWCEKKRLRPIGKHRLNLHSLHHRWIPLPLRQIILVRIGQQQFQFVNYRIELFLSLLEIHDCYI